MRVQNNCMVGLCCAVLVMLTAVPTEAAIVSATKDVTVGQYLDPGINFSSAEGNLEIRDQSTAKLSVLIGGFDVSQFSSITSAKLNFYYMDKAVSTAGGSLGAHALTLDWDESTATLVTDLNLRPSDGLVQSGYSTVGQNVDYYPSESYDWGPRGAQNKWLEIDVLNIVQNWVNGSVGSGDKGILLSGGVWSGLITIGSTETAGDFAPYLSIEGTHLVPEPSAMFLFICSATLACGRFRRR